MFSWLEKLIKADQVKPEPKAKPNFKLSSKSKGRLIGVHIDLVHVVERAIEISTKDFSVLEGVRSLDRQRMLVANGKSQTLNSRHLSGHAVDLVPHPVSWEWEEFYPIADAMIAAAKELDVPLRWGGMWQTYDVREWNGSAKALHKKYRGKFPDAPHFELSRKHYGR